MVFDVGQGLALAFKSGKYIWIYDTGPAFSKMSSTEQVILPYLRRYQKTNASYGLIISHGDADHAGDIESLYDYANPLISWTSQPDRLAVKGFEFCQQGMKWKNYDLQIEVLYPFPNTDLSTVSSNNHSCVVRFTMQGKVFLLMGDLETQAELDFVSYYRDELKANVLIAGHHGAAKSSSYALLKHVQPEYVVFSSGYMNKFGHPSAAVLNRLDSFESDSNDLMYNENNAVRLFNTVDNGALRFRVEVEGGQIYVDSARQDSGSLWLHQE